MRNKLVYLLSIALIALGLALEIFVSKTKVETDAFAESAFTIVGGLRSMVVEVIWFKADRLQREGRFAELAQLAELLVHMEPHTPEVWNYAASNFAYNIADEMTRSEDRWRWVDSGIRLLRDRGLKYNPRSPEICRQLAWIYMLKIGKHSLDPAANYYQERLTEMVRKAQEENSWEDIGMKKAKMAIIEADIGSADWTDPYLHAMYWAYEGGLKGDLLTIYMQSKIVYQRAHNMIQ